MAGQNLSPVPNRSKRLVTWGVLSVVLLFAPIRWWDKLILIPLFGVVLGTYRRFRISPGALKQRWTIAFFDRPPLNFKLKRYTRIEVKYVAQTSAGEAMMFGLLGFLFGWILDAFFPWLGGTYQIWFVRGTDEQVLAWQGSSQVHYENNLETLKASSGLEAIVR
ncbi:hypothetical protein [Thalassoglobus polymorphus]|uniref:hypothetical protein n=1 Tax=Thalassoglobus polymorphus TaxID=2527994 RepID=UPI0011A7D07A|nr:hypothetical protein [Thalassoglobus polymorphus]